MRGCSNIFEYLRLHKIRIYDVLSPFKCSPNLVLLCGYRRWISGYVSIASRMLSPRHTRSSLSANFSAPSATWSSMKTSANRYHIDTAWTRETATIPIGLCYTVSKIYFKPDFKHSQSSLLSRKTKPTDHGTPSYAKFYCWRCAGQHV